MLLLSALVIGIVAGLAMRGSLWNLTNLRLRHWPLLLAALLTQVAIFSSPLASSPLVLGYGGLVYSLTLIAVLVVLSRNLHIQGMRLLLLGAALNTLVIVCNGGQMPVDQAKLAAALGQSQSTETTEPFINTAPMSGSARLAFLADVIETPDFLPVRNVLSIGDVLIAAGAALLIALAMRTPTPRPVPVGVISGRIGSLPSEG